METKHTKGKWTIDKYNSIVDQNGNTILATGLRLAGSSSNKEAEANAKLIAAAPELLEALNKLYSAIDSCIDLTPELLKECQNAIKKATE